METNLSDLIAFADARRKCEIKELEFIILSLVEKNQDYRIGLIQQEAGIYAASMSRVLRRLDENGWIKRVEDKDDHRKARLALTEKGAAVLEKIQALLKT